MDDLTNPTTRQDANAATLAKDDTEDLMGQLLESTDFAEPRSLRRGEVVEGTVMSVDANSVLVDIGFKSEGVVPVQEMLSLGADPLTKLSAGDQVLVFVVQPETADGQVALSIDRARGEQGWRELQNRFESGDIFEAEVTGYNKGGLLANIEGVNAFIPMSQVVGAKPGTDGANPLSAQVGRTLRLKVIEINRRRNRVILSERAALQEWRAEQKDRLLEELAEGEVRSGTVTSIRNFGVFVDLGGADGLVHLSELSWDRNASPEDLVKVGDQVKVFVMKVDRESRKIALSIRRAAPEEWESLITRYQVSDIVPGVITKLVAFGAFARLPGPVEGLVHVSELVDRRIGHPNEVVEEGDVVPLKIVRIEHDRHRLGLSLREARTDAELRGWRFDDEGRVIEVSEDGREAFASEAESATARYEARRTEASSRATQTAERAAEPAAAASGGGQQAPAPPRQEREDAPVLTAMQAAMQQAQAELQERQSESPTAEASAGEAPTAEAPTAEAPADEAVTAEAPADEAVTPVAEAPEAPEAPLEAPAAEAPEAELPVDEAPRAEAAADEAPAAEVAADEVPADETPADEVPADEAPATVEGDTAGDETAEETDKA